MEVAGLRKLSQFSLVLLAAFLLTTVYNTLLEYFSQCHMAYDGLPRYRLRCACESANSRPVLPHILTDSSFSLDG